MAETTKTLQEHSAEEQLALSYAELCRLRRAAFRAHVAAMEPNVTMAAWEKAMAKKYGTAQARAHYNVVSWKVALMIARYGEAIEHWPNAFSADDVTRATEWLNQAKFGVQYEPLTETRIAELMVTLVPDANTGKLVPSPLFGLDEKEG